MTKKQIDRLVSKVATLEGKKSEVSAGNIREILAHLADIGYDDVGAIVQLIGWGKKRAEQKESKRSK